jgi:hypothetical protein
LQVLDITDGKNIRNIQVDGPWMFHMMNCIFHFSM